MGTLFTFLAVRIALVVITVASVSMTVVTAIAGSQPPFDPFAPYADILPGQSLENVLAHGFYCQSSGPLLYGESCSLTPETGTFSEIQVSIANGTGQVSKVVFIAREQMVVLGHLARLWGKPKTVIYGQTVNFRWPNAHVLTVLQNYSGRFSYWLPITYVAFESAK